MMPHSIPQAKVLNFRFPCFKSVQYLNSHINVYHILMNFYVHQFSLIIIITFYFTILFIYIFTKYLL